MNLEFWTLDFAPHFIHDEVELREYDRQALLAEYLAFLGDLLQHARTERRKISFSIFTNQKGKVVCGYGVPKELRFHRLQEGLRYMSLTKNDAAAKEWENWRKHIDENEGFKRITKRLRFVLGGSIEEAGQVGEEQVIGQALEENEFPILEFHSNLRDLLTRREVICIPTASPWALKSTDTRWLATLSQAVTATEPGEGVIISIGGHEVTNFEVDYVHKCIQMYLRTYRGLAEQSSELNDLAIHRAILGQADIFRAEIQVTHGMIRPILQDTDAEVFQTFEPEHYAKVGIDLADSDDETVKIISTIPRLYDKFEALCLILPPFTFRDALPGLMNKVPMPFVVSDTGTSSSDQNRSGWIRLGQAGRGVELTLSPQELTRHMFISGGSGSGKSTSARDILLQLPADVKCLIIDPVKESGSYHNFRKEWSQRTQMGNMKSDPLRVFELGRHRPPRINPFQVPPGSTVFSHSSLIARILSLLSPTTAKGYEYWLAMIRTTYIQKVAEIRNLKKLGGFSKGLLLYENSKTAYSRLLGADNWCEAWPTLDDLKVKGLPWLIRMLHESGGKSEHSIEVREHYTRWWQTITATHPLIMSMMSGDISVEPWWCQFFQSDTLITLGAVTDHQENSTLVALLLMLLNEYRIGSAVESGSFAGTSRPLTHITLIEEAHRVMPKSARGYGKDVMSSPEEEVGRHLAQMLAEVREYGEGIILAEQSPDKLLPDAIINTGTKIVKRTTYGLDIQCLADSLGLSIRERAHLSRLLPEEAIVVVPTGSQPMYVTRDLKGHQNTIQNEQDRLSE